MHQDQLDNYIYQAVLAVEGKRHSQTIINTWSMAPVAFWDWVRLVAIPSIEGKQVRKDRQATILKFYCHIMGSISIWRDEGEVMVSNDFLKKFRIFQATALGNDGTDLELFPYQSKKIGDDENKSYAIWPTDSLLSLYNQPDERITLKKYLTLKKFPQKVIQNIETSFRPITQKKVTSLWRKEFQSITNQIHKLKIYQPIINPTNGTTLNTRNEVSVNSPMGFSDLKADANSRDDAIISKLGLSLITLPIPDNLSDSIPVDLVAAYRMLEKLPKAEQAILRGPLDYIARYTRNGRYTPRYRINNSYCGRLFEHGQGLQGLKREIRATLLKSAQEHGYLFNYDIKKCQASILSLLFEHHGLDCSFLRKLIAEFIPICDALDIEPDLMKTALYAPMNGGSHKMINVRTGKINAVARQFFKHYRERMDKEHARKAAEGKLEVVHHFLKPLCLDLKRLRKKMLNNYQPPRSQKAPPSLSLGAVLTTIEQAFIHCLVVLLESKGIAVLSLQHDGIITNQPIPSELSDLAGQLTGFTNAEMELKPL